MSEQDESPVDCAVVGPAAVRLGELLRETRQGFIRTLRSRELSEAYLGSAGAIVEEFAGFCEGAASDDAWPLRRQFLAHRASLRRAHRFSASYLDNHGRELRRFVTWYAAQSGRTGAPQRELSDEPLRSYWLTQPQASPYRRKILRTHLPGLLAFLSRRFDAMSERDPGALLEDYFEQRRLELRGRGWGTVLRHRARIVTRRHLVWLECHGLLPGGSAAASGSAYAARELRAMAPGETSPAQALAEDFAARVDRELPRGLRQPLVEYLEHLVYERELNRASLRGILRSTRALCRLAADKGLESFHALEVGVLDEVVAALVSAPADDLLRRREQVRARHSELRGFLRYLHRRGHLRRELAAVLISPPCYRASRPPTVLTQAQLRRLLASVDRDAPRGRRRYAVLLLMSTYGLRPVDVARLRLEAIDWRQERIVLVQSKTGGVLTLPLLAEVAQALYAYLRQERSPQAPHRQVFLASYWPHRPLRAPTIAREVNKALRAAELGWASARHLRSSVATHLLRQGEALSTIQDVLGHRTPETTVRYASADVELLRQVLEESER